MTKQQNPPIGPGDHVFLVDGSSFVFRAYFQSINQDAKYNYRSDGLPTGALRLFSTKLYQFIREGAVGIMPTHLAILFDKSEETFRKEIYPDYKATRRDPPDDLVPQFPLMREAVTAFGLEPIEKAGYEADDLIATYAIEAEKAGAEVLIISSDKDLMQLVTDRILFYDFESGIKGRPGHRPERKLDIDGVIDYFGVPPEKVTDVQALVGDTSDNVPGVPGIGIKTASQLIKDYGDLETLLARAEEIKQPKRRETLIEYADQARLSKRLVTLDRHVDCEVPLAATRVGAFDAKKLIAFAKALELTTLTKRVAEASDLDPNSVDADPNLKSDKLHAATYAAKLMPAPEDEGEAEETAKPEKAAPKAEAGAFAPPERAIAAATAATAVPVDLKAYGTVTEAAMLEALVAVAMETGHVAIAAEMSSPDPMQG
ncbi:MAG: DNA polymerase I, partial [Bauldia sp.]|nr:DNA polymerase I [Bauldia sp.]